jgi:pimeloyl-ACP methyl ester carboxylesterase
MGSYRLILLPGMGTDQRVYTIQRQEFPSLIVPEWIEPKWKETLPDYAARMAASLISYGPCIVGGLSFGGMVALELTHHLPAIGCLLLSSIRSRKQLPCWAKWLGPGAFLLPRRTDRILSATGRATLAIGGSWLPISIVNFCRHASKTESTMLPWACRAVVRWPEPTAPWPCPVRQLHGGQDPILPARWTTPDDLIPEAGHLLPLTHPFAVNAWLRRQVDDLVHLANRSDVVHGLRADLADVVEPVGQPLSPPREQPN